MQYNNVIIRPITEDDTEKIIAWRNSPEVQNNFIYRSPLTREGHLSWFNNRVKTGEVAQFIIFSNDLQQSVGSVYLRDIDHTNQKAEFGIFIGESSARGHGIGKAAAKLILEYGFKRLGLNRIFLRVFARNTAAIKSYENAGFTKDGLFRQDVIIDGCKEDVVFMSVLREDFLDVENKND